MAIETRTINRQPSKLDYSAQTQFRLMINYLPLTEYFNLLTVFNIPTYFLMFFILFNPIVVAVSISSSTIKDATTNINYD